MSTHAHCNKSFLDGYGSAEQHVRAAIEAGLPGLAITDHKSTSAWYELEDAAKEKNFNPVFGVEGYFAEDRHRKEGGRDSAHILLIAKSQLGLRNINRLMTDSWREGFYYQPRCDWELLERYSEDVILTSGCVSSPVAQAVKAKDYDRAYSFLAKAQDVFGENFYLELQPHDLEDQIDLNKFLVSVSGIPYVVSNDSHYPYPDDADAQDVSVCIATRSNIDLPADKRMKLTGEFYIKSTEQLYEDLQRNTGVPDGIAAEAAENCRRILAETKVELPRDKALIPDFPDPVNTMHREVSKGLHERILPNIPEELHKQYLKRAYEEFSTIRDKGYCEYFLVTADMVNAAKERNIWVGPGRGSAGGSLVSYALGIIDVDPIEHGLSFERFLASHRNDPPDIDVDFAGSGREKVFNYLVKRWGEEHVVNIANYSMLNAKGALRDVLSVSGVKPDEWMNAKINEIGNERKYSSIADYFQQNPQQRQVIPDGWKKIFERAEKIEGTARQISRTAAGVIISKEPIADYAAIVQTKNGFRVCSYNKEDAAKIGFLKMDVLGLSTCDILQKAHRIAQIRGEDPPENLWHLPRDDEDVLRIFRPGWSVLIFQFGEGPMQELLSKLKPDSFDELVAANALVRTGADEGAYIRNKQDPNNIEYIHESLRPILQDTLGVLVYQEQLMRICREVAGLDWPEVHKIRKLTSAKKDVHLVRALQQQFVEGCCKHSGFTPRQATDLWAYIERTSKYQFNLSHAVAYTTISYACAYMQHHHPLAWFLANMQVAGDDGHEFTKIKNLASEKYGIAVDPPDVNASYQSFWFRGDTIVSGLSSLKNLGKAAADGIIKERDANGPYGSLEDMQQRLTGRVFNKRTQHKLKQYGCIPGIPGDKVSIMAKYGRRGDSIDIMRELQPEPHPFWGEVTTWEDLPDDEQGWVLVNLMDASKGPSDNYKVNLFTGERSMQAYLPQKVDDDNYVVFVQDKAKRRLAGALTLEEVEAPPDEWEDYPQKQHLGIQRAKMAQRGNKLYPRGYVYLFPSSTNRRNSDNTLFHVSLSCVFGHAQPMFLTEPVHKKGWYGVQPGSCWPDRRGNPTDKISAWQALVPQHKLDQQKEA